MSKPKHAKKVIKTIVYDFDGVVVNSLKYHYLAIKAVLDKCDLPTPPIKKMNDWWYAPYDNRFKELGVNLSQKEIEEIYGKKINDKDFTFFPNFVQTVLQLKRKKYSLFIVSATPYLKPISKILSEHNIMDHFTDIQYNCHNKESILIELMKTYKLVSTQVVYIGDTKNDMTSGIGAGVIPIGFDGGFGAVKSLIKAGAKEIIKDHKQIIQLLRSRA